MRIPRSLLVSDSNPQVFHVISRVVDKRFIFQDKEKAFFLSLIRSFESYSGLQVLSYCLMGNHFHLLLYVPAKPENISTDEIRRRMTFIYSQKKIAEFDALIQQMKDNGVDHFEEEFYQKQRARMHDLSSYVKELKERFTKWYNKRTDRSGTLWESRFKSLLVAGEEGALMNVAAYIELNSVRAGLADEPQDYRWCSYTEAVAGGQKARAGITRIVGTLESNTSWENTASSYRRYFIHKGASQNGRRKGFNEEKANQEIRNEGHLGEVSILKTKMRYFTDGVVIGSQRFIEDFVKSHKAIVGENRKILGTEVKGCGVFSLRNVR